MQYSMILKVRDSRRQMHGCFLDDPLNFYVVLIFPNQQIQSNFFKWGACIIELNNDIFVNLKVSEMIYQVERAIFLDRKLCIFISYFNKLWINVPFTGQERVKLFTKSCMIYEYSDFWKYWILKKNHRLTAALPRSWRVIPTVKEYVTNSSPGEDW